MATLSVGEKTKSSTAVRVIYAMLSYALGLWMLLYGMSKITALQFQVFPSTYVKPLAEVRSFFAIATFFGRFHWLAVLLGFVESIPSILLLFSVLTVVTGMLIVDVGLLLLDQKTRKRIRELFFLNLCA